MNIFIIIASNSLVKEKKKKTKMASFSTKITLRFEIIEKEDQSVMAANLVSCPEKMRIISTLLEYINRNPNSIITATYNQCHPRPHLKYYCSTYLPYVY